MIQDRSLCARPSTWLSSEEPTCKAGATGDAGSIPGSGRSFGGGRGNALQCSRLETLLDREAWWATVPGVAESNMTEATQHTRVRMCEYMRAQSLQSCPTLCNAWTVACQAPLSMGFSRREYRRGLPFPSPEIKYEVSEVKPLTRDRMDCSPPAPLPWDFPGGSTRVGCHRLLQCVYIHKCIHIHIYIIYILY